MNFPFGTAAPNAANADNGCKMSMMQLAALLTIIREKHEQDTEGQDNDRKIPARELDLALATSLQNEEWNRYKHESVADASLAALLDPQESMDVSLAISLYEEEQRENSVQDDARLAAEYAMYQSVDGRAWLFVRQVVDLHMRLSASTHGLTVVSVDDMVFLGKNFVQCADDFEANGRSSCVTLAYHYTRNQCMDRIRQDGLMTIEDRQRTYADLNDNETTELHHVGIHSPQDEPTRWSPWLSRSQIL